ncbi:MAG: shikimate kinase [Spirochaetaceae bacterium]|jgi:shikimate kinase|nr:shikimate kinase [Spirochaetaceae bacterium]
MQNKGPCLFIVLVGPKHCGKTAAACALASLVNGTFIDLDAEIERRTGTTVRALYCSGADTFRRAEAAALRAVLEGEGGTVLAAGGGLIDNEAAMEALTGKPDVLLVFLEIDAETAWERVSKNAETTGVLPPFLQTENPQATHRLLHDRRNAAYKHAAAITIPAAGKTPAEIAHEILYSLRATLIK